MDLEEKGEEDSLVAAMEGETLGEAVVVAVAVDHLGGNKIFVSTMSLIVLHLSGSNVTRSENCKSSHLEFCGSWCYGVV